MTYNKTESEKLIQDSILFTLDKETESVAYKNEALKMVENLYKYLLAINKEKYEPYGCEIYMLAQRCIASFSGSNGEEFLHYFNAAWKKEYSHILGNEAVDSKFRGLKLTEQERRDYKKYAAYLSKSQNVRTAEEKYALIADLMNVSVDRVMTIAESAETHMMDNFSEDGDGDEVDTFEETIADDFSIEGYFDDLTGMKIVLDNIETVFQNLQDRQKSIVSDMLTLKLGSDVYEMKDVLQKYSFLNPEIGRLIMEGAELPTQREIAEKYGKNEASISRTMKEFIQKLSDVMEGKQ